MRYLVFLTLLLFIFGFQSCKNFDRKFSNNHSANANDSGFYTLHLAPRSGEKYNYLIKNESETSREVDEKEYHSTNAMTVGMQWRFDKDSNNNLKLNLQYNQFVLKGEADDEHLEIDASKADSSSEIGEKVFSVFKDASIFANVSNLGSVNNITGLNELSGRILTMAGDGGLSTDEIKVLNETLGKLVNERYFKQMLEQALKVFPNAPVSIGSTWKIESALQSDLELPVFNEYVLEDVEDSIATITCSSKLLVEEKPLVLQGITVTASIKGEQEGRLTLNINTGMLVSAQTQFNLKGSIFLLGKEVPITVRNKVSIASKVLSKSEL